jgi:hypothetical protein
LTNCLSSLKSDNKILGKKRSKWFLTKGEKNPKLPDTKGKKDIGPIDTKISEAHIESLFFLWVAGFPQIGMRSQLIMRIPRQKERFSGKKERWLN